MAKIPRYVKTEIVFSNKTVSVYAGVKVSQALAEVKEGMDLYKGVRLFQLLEAVYAQGQKDGARQVRDAFAVMMSTIPHQNPGKPPKKTKKG